MKFENPIINISMFEVENIITTSNDPYDATTGEGKAKNAFYRAGLDPNAAVILSFN